MTDQATATPGADGAGVPAEAVPAQASQPTAPWYAGEPYTDDDRAYLTNKGWHEGDAVPPKVLQSYRHLERVMGAKAHALIPPKMDDANARAQFFGALGRPEDPNGYSLPKSLEDARAAGAKLDDAAIERFRGLAHKADLLPHQFQAVVEGYERMNAESAEAADVAYNGQVAQTVEKLRTEFGNAYGEHVARGNLAMQQLGLSRDDVAAISDAIGVERATRTLMQIGATLAQHKSVGLGGGGNEPDSFITGKAQAAAKISDVKLGRNAEFRKAMLDPGHPEHKATIAQWREWQRVANS